VVMILVAVETFAGKVLQGGDRIAGNYGAVAAGSMECILGYREVGGTAVGVAVAVVSGELVAAEETVVVAVAVAE